MFIEDLGLADHPPCDDEEEVTAAAVLRSCAEEATRQAGAIARMDEAFGLALMAGQSTELDVPGPGPGPGMTRTLAASLQQVDRLRQEAEGLARVLSLLAQLPPRRTTLLPAELRACTPLVALQHRLLAGARGGVP